MKADRNALLMEAGKALVATIVATSSACWTARGVLADYDRRLSVVEVQQQYSSQQISSALGEIRSDVRELRAGMLAEQRGRP